MADKKPKKAAPSKKDANGDGERDPKTGQFLPGWSGGPGRPRRPDLYLLAQEGFGIEGLRARLLAVLEAMMQRAEEGDVQAAKLMCDRLASTDPLEVNVNDARTLTNAERVEKIRAVFAAAQAEKAKKGGAKT